MAEPQAQDNAQVVRQFLEGVLTGEFRSHLVADNVVWHVGGRNQISDDYRGHDGIGRLFAKMGEVVGLPPAGRPGVEHNLEFHDMLANDEHVVVLWRRHGQRAGVTLDSPGVGVYHVRDGKITEVWAVHWDQPAADAYFGSA
ncbi:hypothetical protein BH23CHL7_BH23CHL7_17360 [soil metagenome]